MLPERYLDLLEAPNTAVLVSLGPGGAPHASPVWFLYEDGELLVSTTAERQKHRNLVRDPRVAFTVVDPAEPLRYVEVRGTVVLAADPDGIVRDAIARKHGFADGRAFDPPGARRVTARIVPGRVIEH